MDDDMMRDDLSGDGDNTDDLTDDPDAAGFADDNTTDDGELEE